MRIQFIITGWHYNQEDYINGLKDLNEMNEAIDIFWSCHKEPPKIVKDNFKYQVFPNEGLEDGAYQQALDVLELEDYTILFCMHDDLIIKNWEFVHTCINMLDKYKVVANCMNYPMTVDPNAMAGDKKFIDYVKPECKPMFDQVFHNMPTIRESFLCMRYIDLKRIGEFEVVWEEPQQDENGNYAIGGIGNTQQTLLAYKVIKVFGVESIGYLGDRYLDSPYIYELARGHHDDNNPMS